MCTYFNVHLAFTVLESSWNVMTHGDVGGKWRWNWRMDWVASTLHTTSEHGVSSITTADAHTSTDSSRLNWRPADWNGLVSFRRKTKSGFCACAITFQMQSTSSSSRGGSRLPQTAFVAICCRWVFDLLSALERGVKSTARSQNCSVHTVYSTYLNCNGINPVVPWHILFVYIFLFNTTNI